MTPEFQIARQTANHIHSGYREGKDQNMIESILSEAVASGDQQSIQKNIIKILSQVSPERQPMAIKYLENTMANIENKQVKEKQRVAAEKYGVDADLHPSLQAQVYKDKAKEKRLESVYGQSQGQNQEQQTIQGQNQEQQPGARRLSKDQLIQRTGHPDKEISEPSKAQLKEIENQEKATFKEKKAERDELIEFHKESKAYDEELSKNSRIAKKQLETVRDLTKTVDKLSPKSISNIFSGFGDLGDKIADAFLSKDEARLKASVPLLLEGWKQVFGVRLTDADLAILNDKLPSIGKSVEANKAILNVIEKYSKTALLRSQIAADIKKQNNGLRPLGFADKVEERYDEMTKPVLIINPNTGRTIAIPAYELSNAMKSGAKLANE